MSTEATRSPAATMPAAFFGHGNPMNALEFEDGNGALAGLGVDKTRAEQSITAALAKLTGQS